MRLYEPVHDRFERFCRARVYGEMDHGDLINETLLQAFQKFDTLRSKTAFLSFLFSIAIRILANANRKRRPQRMGENEEVNQVSDPHANAERSLEVRMLYEAMAKLPAIQRESLILFEISGFSIKEIMELHGVGESAVKQRLRRGRSALADILQETEIRTGGQI